MKVIIENGVTIIKTGDSNGGVKNKHNKAGVSHHHAENGTIKYRAEIQIKGTKHYLGIRDTVEEAIELRQEAERQIANGTFDEWVAHVKNPINKSKYRKIGVSQFKASNGTIQYMIQIKVDGTRHYIGKRKTLKEAYDIYEEAESQVENGTFEEWYEQLKSTRKPIGRNIK